LDGGSRFTAANNNVTYACNGASGQDGQDGQDGTSLVGSPCSLPDNTAGTVQMNVGANGAISFNCQTSGGGGGGNLCADTLPDYPNSTTHCDPATGTLTITCDSGYANGDNNITTGCETNLMTDPLNCGALGNLVSFPHAMGACVNGQAVLTACIGENYDVDHSTSNGCERLQPYMSHTPSTAQTIGSLPCDDGSSTRTFSGDLYSDTRLHQNPTIPAFDGLFGSAPAWYRVDATGGLLCFNDYSVTFTTSGGSASQCYRLTFQTNILSNDVEVSGQGSATMSGGAGSYSDGTSVYFKVEKVCTTAIVTEAIHYTIQFHL
jgi:hypothetical protein